VIDEKKNALAIIANAYREEIKMLIGKIPFGLSSLYQQINHFRI